METEFRELHRNGRIDDDAAAQAIALERGTLLQRRSAALSMGTDYVLLLGALIFSADVGYAESQFHGFGEHWSWDLLILTVLHAATAYVFESALVLSLSLASLAAWFGVGMRFKDLLNDPAVSGWSPLVCAGVILGCSSARRCQYDAGTSVVA